MLVGIAVIIVCVALSAVSAKSALVLGPAAPWTSAGWWLTVVYCAAVVVKIAAHIVIPLHGEYAALVAMTAAFVVAGVRDERQAEPWWWPVRAGRTRAERRTADASGS